MNENQLNDFLSELKVKDNKKYLYGGDIYKCCVFISEEGCRIGAAARLKAQDFFFERGEVNIPDQKIGHYYKPMS